jgi:hypothetical protein
MMRTFGLTLALSLAVFTSGTPAQSGPDNLSARLESSNEVPAVSSPAEGSFRAT